MITQRILETYIKVSIEIGAILGRNIPEGIEIDKQAVSKLLQHRLMLDYVIHPLAAQGKWNWETSPMAAEYLNYEEFVLSMYYSFKNPVKL